MTQDELYSPVDQQIAEPSSAKRKTTAQGWTKVAGLILVVALVATSALWLTAKSTLADTQDQLAATQSQLATANESLASNVATAQAKQAALDAVPDLQKIATRYFPANSTGDKRSVQVSIGKSQIYILQVPLRGMLSELGFSSAVMERMQLTRALDGTLTAEGKNCNVSWTYHPDDGLNMVFETA